MPRDWEDNDRADPIDYRPIDGEENFQVQWIAMCGYRIVDKDKNPITPFWTNDKEAAKIMLHYRNQNESS